MALKNPKNTISYLCRLIRLVSDRLVTHRLVTHRLVIHRLITQIGYSEIDYPVRLLRDWLLIDFLI